MRLEGWTLCKTPLNFSLEDVLCFWVSPTLLLEWNFCNSVFYLSLPYVAGVSLGWMDGRLIDNPGEKLQPVRFQLGMVSIGGE